MKIYEEIEKSFPAIEKQFTQDDLLEFKNAAIGDLNSYHFGLGLWIRNNLLYPDDSILYNLFLENGIKYPDEMSSLMIKLFHYCLSKKESPVDFL